MEFIFGYPEIICAVILFSYIHRLTHKNLPTNWPVIGMLLSLVLNLSRLHDWATGYLSRNGCTIVFKGPWFSTLETMLVTSDPDNVHYIFNTNFSNYPIGSDYKESFDILGNGVFNADYDAWKTQRKAVFLLINASRFKTKMENGLIPVFEHVLEQNTALDLQDTFKRFTFDLTYILFSGMDPCSLTIAFEKVPLVEAMDAAEEAIFYRHVVPKNFWKLQRWLGIGAQKNLADAKERLDQFLYKTISAKREKQGVKAKGNEEEEKDSDLQMNHHASRAESDIFLRGTFLNFMVAGSSGVAITLSWFFWLVSKNPMVQLKIIQEISSMVVSPRGKKVKVLDSAAFCETLRLFPPIPFEHKKSLGPDVLPSGHRVDPKTKIFPLIYSMGRMETVWGEDCLEFKPERWISEDGRIKHVPFYKFMAFNSGPRTCIGKDMAFLQMKLAAATILYNYDVQVGESHPIPQKTLFLYMNHGIKAKIKRRL
ncbi:hypothetical protein ACHQM5_008329 [Ranunculus cassubicifolius]